MPDREKANTIWRWGVALIYAALAVTLIVHEYKAQALLVQAKTQAADGKVADALTTLETLALRYPIAMSVPPAREALHRLEQDEDWQDQIMLHRGRRQVSPWQDLHPLTVDWLPLWGWPGCGIALFVVCLTRLGRRNGWAGAALALSIVTVVGTLCIWGWYGFAIGDWFTPMVQRIAPLMQDPGALYLATWALVAITAAMLLCPIVKPIDPDADARSKARPNSPNDPRMALEYLDAQRRERGFTNVEYARRREAILSQI